MMLSDPTNFDQNPTTFTKGNDREALTAGGMDVWREPRAEDRISYISDLNLKTYVDSGRTGVRFVSKYQK